MKIDDRRGAVGWLIKIPNDKCPYLYYPNIQVACKLLEGAEDDYCCAKGCPLKKEY